MNSFRIPLSTIGTSAASREMINFVTTPPGALRAHAPLQLCRGRHARATPVKQKIIACDASSNPNTGPTGDGASRFAAADLALLQSRISSLRAELVETDRRVARNWRDGEYRTSVVACVPGENFVRRLAIDASLMVCGTADGTVCLFNLDTHDRAVYTHANSGQTTAVAIDGAFVASVGSRNQSITVWNVARYRSSRDWANFPNATQDGPSLPRPSFRLTSGHTNIITALKIDASSRRLYSASVDGTICVWCLDTGTLVKTIFVGEPVLCMALTEHSHVLVGCASGRVSAYQSTRGTHLLSLQAHSANTTSICFNDETQVLATGSATGSIKVWSFDSGKCVATPPSHDAAVMSLQLDQTKLVSGSRDGTIAVTSIKDGQRLYAVGGYTGFLSSLSFDKDFLIADGTNNLIAYHDFTPLPLQNI